MEIIKRDGRLEPFDISKIENAIAKALASTGEDRPSTLALSLAEKTAAALDPGRQWSVEEIQDKVEEALMSSCEFQAARNYILFRSQRSERRSERQRLWGYLQLDGLDAVLEDIQREFPGDEYSLSVLCDKFIAFSKEDMDEDERLEALIRAAVELTRPEAPRWEFIASRFLLFSFRRKLSARLRFEPALLFQR